MTLLVDGIGGYKIVQGTDNLTLNFDGTTSTLSSTVGDMNLTVAPGYTINISGLNNSGTLVLNGTAGTAGQVATSQGPSAPAIWANGAITLGTTAVALGSTALTLAGLTTVTVTQNPLNALDLATKGYVDAATSAVNRLAPAAVATIGADVALTGLYTLDGYAIQAGDRVLVKNQTNPAQNGLYQASSTAWSYTSDANTWAEYVAALVFVLNGTINTNTSWIQIAPAGGTLGTTPLVWAEQSAPLAYTAGPGLSLSGSQFINTGVITISGGTTGLTAPVSAGVATLGGTLAIGNGGTGLSSVGTAGTLFVSDGTNASWTNTVPAAVTINATNVGSPSPLAINSTNTRGGAGYAEMLSLSNLNAGATNQNKFIRMSNTGGLEVVNSAYSGVILGLTDSGVVIVPGHATVTSGFATTSAIAFNNLHSGVWDDGNLHLVSQDSNIWIDSLNSGTIQLGKQPNTGTGSPVSAGNSITAAATAGNTTAFIAGPGAVNGVALQMNNNMAIRDVTNGSSTIFFDVSQGGTANGSFVFRSSNAFNTYLNLNAGGANFNVPVVTNQTIGNSFVRFASIPQNSAVQTGVSLDNLNCRFFSGGGSSLQPQLSAVSGSFTAYYLSLIHI